MRLSPACFCGPTSIKHMTFACCTGCVVGQVGHLRCFSCLRFPCYLLEKDPDATLYPVHVSLAYTVQATDQDVFESQSVTTDLCHCWICRCQSRAGFSAWGLVQTGEVTITIHTRSSEAVTVLFLWTSMCQGAHPLQRPCFMDCYSSRRR